MPGVTVTGRLTRAVSAVLPHRPSPLFNRPGLRILGGSSLHARYESTTLQRTLITLIIIACAALIIILMAGGFGGNGSPSPDTARPDDVQAPQPADQASSDSVGSAEQAQPAAGSSEAQAAAQTDTAADGPSEDSTGAGAPQAVEPLPIETLPPLRVRQVPVQAEPVIGSTAPADSDNPYMFEAKFSPWSAGLIHLKLSRYSHSIKEHVPYTVQQRVFNRLVNTQPTYQYPFGSRVLVVNNQRIDLTYARWKLLTSPDPQENGGVAEFELIIEDAESGTDVLRVVRRFQVVPAENDYDLRMTQHFENKLASTEQKNGNLKVRWIQSGAGDLPLEGAYMGDRRTMVMGYVRPDYDKSRSIVETKGANLARGSVVEQEEVVWPTEAALENNYELIWAALSNRYFTAAMHLPVEPPAGDGPQQHRVELPALDNTYPVVDHVNLGVADSPGLLLTLEAQPLYLKGLSERSAEDPPDPGQSTDGQTPETASSTSTATLELSAYCGPKSARVIDKDPVYSALGLHELIIYNLGGCCSALTFSWLAEFLVNFLRLLHDYIMFDWGLAIIALVIVVRAILHPLTKKSQLNMMKFSKQMQGIQPEMERLKKKYKDNQTKLNQEMMKLYREKGVNPAAMGLGCLPMFLQMPIWIALYAMLYFAIELRHQPAFWNMFHHIGSMFGAEWYFLSDLSSADRFIPLPEINLFFVSIDSINLLPLLMAIVFFFQQKFMQPPQTGELTDQQKQQQQMMKIMPFIFPFLLYKAPSGLTLYILASTGAGIVDSYLVRRHLKQLEAEGKLDAPAKKPRKAGFMARVAKAAEEQQRRLEGKQSGRSKSNKRR